MAGGWVGGAGGGGAAPSSRDGVGRMLVCGLCRDKGWHVSFSVTPPSRLIHSSRPQSLQCPPAPIRPPPPPTPASPQRLWHKRQGGASAEEDAWLGLFDWSVGGFSLQHTQHGSARCLGPAKLCRLLIQNSAVMSPRWITGIGWRKKENE